MSVIAALALCSALAQQPAFPALPGADNIRVYHCYRATTPILVDGRLDDTAWRSAEIATRFTRIYHKDQPVERQTRVRVLWDDHWLYLGFAAPDDDVWATKTQRDDSLWEEEVLEAYLDPNGDGLDYLEFEINPLGALIDLRIPYAGAQADWKTCALWDCEGLVGATRVFRSVATRSDRDHGWSAEMALPFAGLPPERGVPPSPGTEWRVQFFRIDRPAGEAEPHCSSWNDTPAFHLPERFGRMLFEEVAALP